MFAFISIFFAFLVDISAVRYLPELRRRADGNIRRRGRGARRRKEPRTRPRSASTLKAGRPTEWYHHVASGIVRSKGPAYRRDLLHHGFPELRSTERRQDDRREDRGDSSDYVAGQQELGDQVRKSSLVARGGGRTYGEQRHCMERRSRHLLEEREWQYRAGCQGRHLYRREEYPGSADVPAKPNYKPRAVQGLRVHAAGQALQGAGPTGRQFPCG